MDSAVRTTLQASSRLALRTRPCPSCSSYSLIRSTRPSRQSRDYSTTPRRNAIGQSVPGAAAMMGREIMGQMGQASTSKMKGLSKSQLPNDLGLFPGTFTQSAWHTYLPMITTEPKLWLKIQWKILRKPFVNTFGVIYNLYWVRRHRLRFLSSAPIRKKPIPLHLTDRIHDALTLHKQLNTAIANGDKAWLRAHCCTGLADKACSRIDRRSRPSRGTPKSSTSASQQDSTEKWQLVSYNGLFGSSIPPWPLASMLPFTSYKVINDVVGQLPMSNDTLLRQVTVRIRSKQQYNLSDGQGQRTKDVTEHIVLQKIIWQGDDDAWKIWGTVNPSTLKEIKGLLDEDKAGGGLIDRVKAMMPANVGGGGMM